MKGKLLRLLIALGFFVPAQAAIEYVYSFDGDLGAEFTEIQNWGNASYSQSGGGLILANGTDSPAEFGSGSLFVWKTEISATKSWTAEVDITLPSIWNSITSAYNFDSLSLSLSAGIVDSRASVESWYDDEFGMSAIVAYDNDIPGTKRTYASSAGSMADCPCFFPDLAHFNYVSTTLKLSYDAETLMLGTYYDDTLYYSADANDAFPEGPDNKFDTSNTFAIILAWNVDHIEVDSDFPTIQEFRMSQVPEGRYTSFWIALFIVLGCGLFLRRRKAA